MGQIVHIIPGPSHEGQPASAQGTKVVLADGTEVGGVYKVELTAECGEFWKAKLHCNARLGEVTATLVDEGGADEAAERVGRGVGRVVAQMIASRAASNWQQPSQAEQLCEAIARVEAKLDALLEALADDGEEQEPPELTLDGEALGGQRDDSQPL